MKVSPKPYLQPSNTKFGNKQEYPYKNKEISPTTLVAQELKSSLNTAFLGIGIGGILGLGTGLFLSSEHNFKLDSIGIGALLGGAVAMGIRSIKRSVSNFRNNNQS